MACLSHARRHSPAVRVVIGLNGESWESAVAQSETHAVPLKRLAVMTSGGDSPGMNACIRAVVRYANHFGIQTVGVVRGYQGLVSGDYH